MSPRKKVGERIALGIVLLGVGWVLFLVALSLVKLTQWLMSL